MEYKFTREEYDKLSQYLLFELGMEGVLSESKIKAIHAHTRILQESFEEDEVYTVIEEKQNNLAPMKIGFDGTNITISHGVEGNVRQLSIPPQTVKAVWQDPKFQKAPQLLVALGVPIDEVQLRDNGGAISNNVSRIREIYNKRYAASTPGIHDLAAVGKRAQAYWSNRRNKEDLSTDYEEPDGDNVNRGQRGRKDPGVQKINQQEIMAGQFYRDVTRISRSTTSRWIRFWKKDLNAVQSNKKSLLGHLIGRTWKKTFLLGYQVNRTLFFEVWYNSMNSTFSVYDKNGIELTHPIPTLQEAIRMLIRTIAQESPGDRDIFTSGRAGADMAASLGRVFNNGVEKDVKQIRREEDYLNNEIQREAKEKKAEDREKAKERKERMEKSKAARQAQERRNAARATADNGGNWPQADTTSGINRDRVKSAMNSAAKTAQASVAAAAIGMSDANPSTPKANNITSKQAQTNVSIDRMQLDMDDQQIRQYRSSLGYIMGRLSDEQGKLEAVADDPDNLRSLSLDPTIKRAFTNLNDPSEIAQMAANAEKAITKQRNEVQELMSMSDVDFTEELKKKIKSEGKEYATSTPKMMELVLRRLRTQRGMFESALDEMARWDNANASYHNTIDGVDQEKREKEEAVRAQNDANGFNRGQALDDIQFDREAQKVRNQVRSSSYNKQMLIQDITNSIEAYDITRIRPSKMNNIFTRWFSNRTRGRRDALQSPLDRPNFFSRWKQAFFDKDKRVDFIIGYSLSGTINIEVWYITELDPSGNGRMISSFYVYDVTAEKILRSHLPYYRNAMQVISAKLGITSQGL